MNERYFARRLAVELQLADTAPSAAERAVHLDACRHLSVLLGLPTDGEFKRITTR